MADYEATEYGLCPSWALSLGYMGVAAGACLSNWGSAVSSFVFVKGLRKIKALVHPDLRPSCIVGVLRNGCIRLDLLHFRLIPFLPIILGRMMFPMPRQNQNYYT